MSLASHEQSLAMVRISLGLSDRPLTLTQDPAKVHTIDPSLLDMLMPGNDTSLDSWDPWANYVDSMDQEWVSSLTEE